MIYEFMATQDLHGYGKPWAPGAGINKLPPVEDGIYERYGIKVEVKNGLWFLSGTANTAGNAVIADLTDSYIVVGEEYYHLCNSVSNGGFVPSLENPDNLNGVAVSASPANRIYKIPIEKADYEIARIRCYLSKNVTLSGTYGPMICEDNQPAEYSPYANICMPEGFNIWNPTNQEYVQVYAGYVNSNTRELYLRPVYKEYAGEELVGPWMSSMDEYSENATPTEGAFVIDFGGELESFEITPFMLQTLLDSLGIRQHFTDGAGLLNKLMDQAQGRVRSEEELLHLSRPLNVIAIGDQLPSGITFKPISKDVLPGLPGKFIR